MKAYFSVPIVYKESLVDEKYIVVGHLITPNISLVRDSFVSMVRNLVQK